MEDTAALQQQAELIRESGVLGKSRLLRLFDFLVTCSGVGTIPKEAVIAAEVFGKTSAFEVSQDSIVRVYIHNLRRKLDEFYGGPGKHEPVRLTLPKGEYRLSVTPLTAAEAAPGSPPSPPASGSPPQNRLTRRRILGMGAAIVSAMCIGVAAFELGRTPHTAWDDVRASPVWARLLQNGKPIVVVLGDYYLFGDTERTPDVKRLLREFSINSRDDLAQYVQTNPDLAERYMDVGLGYLPTSSAAALANIVPVLSVGERRRVRIVLMSALDPGTIKSANLVYVGLLSGLGVLQKAAFAASRFQLGESYDELIDGKTGHHYFSGASGYAGDNRRFDPKVGYDDYGFVATFAGLGGNQLVIIAATQDEGLRQMADALTDRARLDELYDKVGRTADFEALYQVFSMDAHDLNGKLLVAAPLDPNKIWTAQ